jgi:cephalosporin hydroxylase
MAADGQRLKRAVSDLKAEIAARVQSAQRGVPTFFDSYMTVVADFLISTEGEHQWCSAPLASPDESLSEAAALLRWFDRLITRRDMGRLVGFSERQGLTSGGGISDIFDLDMVMSQGAGPCLAWKGRPLFKTAYDFALVPMLLWEVNPGAILEIGSGSGASAIWMADLLRGLNRTAHVYSVDIQAVDSSYDGVTFFQGDCTEPDSLFPESLLLTAPHPWLVVEDAHVNVAGVLSCLDRHIKRGDYLYIEDSREKVAAIGLFLTTRAERYKVDTRYTDFFGWNATCAPDSILTAL